MISKGAIELFSCDNCTYFNPSSPAHLAASTGFATVNHLGLESPTMIELSWGSSDGAGDLP